MNADQKPEFAAGAPFADALSRQDAGAVIVRFGGEPDAVVDAASLGARGFRIAGAAAHDRLGRLAAVGDLDGDGASDLLTGSPQGDTREGATAGRRRARDPLPAPAGRPTDPGVEEEVEAGCVAARNVEFLIDDSGSMLDTDPQLLRRTAAEYLISKPRNEGEVLGAYEFGSSGNRSSRRRSSRRAARAPTSRGSSTCSSSAWAATTAAPTTTRPSRASPATTPARRPGSSSPTASTTRASTSTATATARPPTSSASASAGRARRPSAWRGSPRTPAGATTRA